jgi:CBS domain-containing protein
MSKAVDVMTHKVATCTPNTSVTQAAAMMRDRDIGDVLIVEDGKLRGIVTDRDIALRGLNGEDDPLITPIKKLMTTRVITGEVDWSLERVAKVMAKHQIRRLPIVRDGQVVGIISLGDVALHETQKDVVTQSLQAISTPSGISLRQRPGFSRALLGVAFGALATTALAMFTWNRSNKSQRRQFTRSELVQTARQLTSAVREVVDQAASSKPLRELRHQLRAMPRINTTRIPFASMK